jgi:uncharacterized protein YbjT (DUF2867 family)
LTDKLILVTGVTGYIGKLLIPRLLEKGYRVRCLVRNLSKLPPHPWLKQVEIVQGDVTRPESLPEALQGVIVAYYLIHSMTSGNGYARRDILAAQNFAHAAEAAGVEQIIYLGGLADPEVDIARHMRSRIETGEALRTTRVPVTEFRAGLVIGPGSISFEMIRFLTEHLPLLIAPHGVKNRNQPVATQDVLAYLLSALDTPACRGKVIEIAGPEIHTYAEIMLTYARLRGLKRWFITLPFIPLGFMAFWVGKLTPVPASIGKPLIDGMRSDSILRNDTAQNIFPHIQPIGYIQAVQHSLEQLKPESLEPVWNDGEKPAVQFKHKGFLIDHRKIYIKAPSEVVYRIIENLGGQNGWLYADWLWRLRGWLDRRLAGGPGLHGRAQVREVTVGDIVDFYRVEEINPGHKIRLFSELKAPGEGWMEWQVKSVDGGSLMSQTAYFAPKGLTGFLYWYLLNPIHRLVFGGLVRAIARQAIK